MSKVSTFVQAVDGKFYQNPVLHGDDWFLCFDDEEDPEVVVRCRSKKEARPMAKARLTLAGVRFRVHPRNIVLGNRLFPPNWEHFEKGFGFYVDILAPIPVPQKYDAVVSSPSSDCRYYAFCLEFDPREVAKLFTGQDPSPHLVSFLTGEEAWKSELESVRRKLQRAVLKQYPELRGEVVTPEMMVARFGDGMTLRRVQ